MRIWKTPRADTVRYSTVQGCPKGVRVETVTLHNTSKEGYACGELGYPPRQATFEWTSNACWVGKYQADVNGIINIADRYLSEESHSVEHTDDNDSAEVGGV
jgi:putative transposase